VDDLAGRTAFITGGASGIGLGIARACAAEGMKLAIVDVDGDALRAVEPALSATTEVAAAVLDVRDREAYARVADEVEARLGPVTLLCNNAGVGGVVSITNLSYEAWDWVIGINLHGVYNGLQTFVPRMIERGAGGHVVNTGSASGLVAGGAGFLYNTSKFAVVGMSEALRLELAPHRIGLTVLCPGPVATNIATTSRTFEPANLGVDDQFYDFFAAVIAAGKHPDEVGPMVLEGVRKNRPFVLTDDLIAENFRARTQEILDAMPPTA